MCIATICCTITNSINRRANEQKEAYCYKLETSFEVLKSQHPSAEVYNLTKPCAWGKKVSPFLCSHNIHQYYSTTTDLARVGHIIYSGKAFCLAMTKKEKTTTPNSKVPKIPQMGLAIGGNTCWELFNSESTEGKQGLLRLILCITHKRCNLLYSKVVCFKCLHKSTTSFLRNASQLAFHLNLIRPTPCHSCQVRDGFVSCSGFSI